jgi:uncharacterized protein (TIGR02391 family)
MPLFAPTLIAKTSQQKNPLTFPKPSDNLLHEIARGVWPGFWRSIGGVSERERGHRAPTHMGAGHEYGWMSPNSNYAEGDEAMARSPKQREPRKAELRPEQMRAAIPRLEKRIEELHAVNVNEIQNRGDPRLNALEQKVNATLDDVFGHDTVERLQFRSVRLDLAPMYMGYEIPIHEAREGFTRGIEKAISSLETIISLFKEKLGDESLDVQDRSRRAFSQLDLYPEVALAVTRLFEDGHYANAVEDACKVLDSLVKMRSGRVDLSGTELMQAVFSAKNPVLKFNDLKTDSEKSEQQGLMFLYAGAMLAFRNPRAHGVIQDNAENALDYIAFISLLAKMLDRATRV